MTNLPPGWECDGNAAVYGDGRCRVEVVGGDLVITEKWSGPATIAVYAAHMAASEYIDKPTTLVPTSLVRALFERDAALNGK